VWPDKSLKFRLGKPKPTGRASPGPALDMRCEIILHQLFLSISYLTNSPSKIHRAGNSGNHAITPPWPLLDVLVEVTEETDPQNIKNSIEAQ
jgi:hypothetical protein